jgi:hypothetical protein
MTRLRRIRRKLHRLTGGWAIASATGRPAFRLIRGFWRYLPGEVAGQRVETW